MKVNDVVRVAEIFPKDIALQDELKWNRRIVRAKALIFDTLRPEQRVWRVEPLHMQDERDYIHVHQYELSFVYDANVMNEDTKEDTM